MANPNEPKDPEVNFKNEIIKTGWILKKSKHIKNYRKRWMLLQGHKLLCYKTKRYEETKESPTEVFDLSLHRYRIDKHKTVKEKFYLIDETVTNSRTFKAFSEIDRNEWVYKLTDSITFSRELSFDKLYVNTTNTRNTGLSISATFESEIGSKSIQDLHDSESEESDNDFGGYIVSILKNGNNINTPNKPVQSRRRTVSKRKEDHEITQQSFRNFRVESLTISQCELPDFSDESDDESDHDDESKLVPLMEENEVLYDCKYDESIIEQLKVFDYNRNDIIYAMNNVVNSNNINEIKDKLDNQNTITTLTFIGQQLITTETLYVQGLDTLLNELIQPIFSQKLVDKKYYNSIVSCLPQLFIFHKEFLNQMNQVYNKENKMNKTVVNVFNEYMMENKEAFIDMNIKYICDYQKICGLFGFTFHGFDKLDEFLREKRKQMKPLSCTLMLPIQLITRYIYLLNNLRNNTSHTSHDYKDINDAIQMMEGINKEINERKVHIENLAQCLQIQEGLQGLKKPIIKPDRTFIEQFIFIKKEIKHQRLFFLFNDILLIANERWKVKHILEVCTLDVKIEVHNKNTKSNKKKSLPEFTLVSAGCGSAIYIGNDKKIINRFKKFIGKWRVKIMSEELRKRNNTLGSLKNELNRQALLYD